MSDRRAICCRAPQPSCCVGNPPSYCEVCESSTTPYGMPWTGTDYVVGGVCADEIKITFTGRFEEKYSGPLPLSVIIPSVSFYVLFPNYSDMETYDMAGGGTVKLKYIGTCEDCSSNERHAYFPKGSLPDLQNGLDIDKVAVTDTTDYGALTISYDGDGSATSVDVVADDSVITISFTGGTYDGDTCVVRADNYAPRVAECIDALGRGLSSSPLTTKMLGNGHFLDGTQNLVAGDATVTYTKISKFKWQLWCPVCILTPAEHTDVEDYVAGDTIVDLSGGEGNCTAFKLLVSTTYDWMEPNYCKFDDFDTSMCLENMTFENAETGDPCDTSLCSAPNWDCTYNSVEATIEVDE